MLSSHTAPSRVSFLHSPKLPVLVGVLAALVLFALFWNGVLNGLSANTKYYAQDYFSLPRAGLAVRFGTNPFHAAEQYKGYGPYSSDYSTHPMLALVLGAPLSYFSPWHGYYLLTAFHLLLHLGIILVFGRRFVARFREPVSGGAQLRHVVFFLAVGAFFPWYVLYVTGQYHSLVVLALALVLINRRFWVPAFLVSAAGKPVLGPAGLMLAARGEWRVVWKIAVGVALIWLPWLFLYYSDGGIRIGLNPVMPEFLGKGRTYLSYSVQGWDQEVSLAQAMSGFVSRQAGLVFRWVLTGALLGAVLVLLRRRPIEIVLGVSALWFFILYARGHEYHATLWLPVLLLLYVEADGRYHRWWFVGLTVLLALPTVWGVFTGYYGVPAPGRHSAALLQAANPALYQVLLWHKPVVALLLTGGIVATEVRQR